MKNDLMKDYKSNIGRTMTEHSKMDQLIIFTMNVRELYYRKPMEPQ